MRKIDQRRAKHLMQRRLMRRKAVRHQRQLPATTSRPAPPQPTTVAMFRLGPVPGYWLPVMYAHATSVTFVQEA